METNNINEAILNAEIERDKWKLNYLELIKIFNKTMEEKDECIDSLDRELCTMRKFINEKGLTEEAFLYVVNNFSDTITN